jgi:tetratricopeptide (TPR) repeat protein
VIDRSVRIAAAVALAALVAGCASTPTKPPPPPAAPRFPDYPTPVVPAALKTTPAMKARHELGWQRLQAGDLRGASREFTVVLKESPGFYPSITGLGFAELADREFRNAAARFGEAITFQDNYLPAWLGQVEAQLALKNDEQALIAMERVLVLDPKREGVRTRVDLVRFRQTQTLIEAGRRARRAGRLPEAQSALDRALAMSPASVIILHELALVEFARGSVIDAEAHTRKAMQLDPDEVDLIALLADILETQGRYRDAANALNNAIKLDPRPEWRARVADLRDRADLAAIPAEFRALPTAETITRGQMAAYIGIKLEDLLRHAPQRVGAVATDIRNHWASPWIVPVTQAGVMDVFPNHTFQPGATVRRGDLALAVAELVKLLTDARPVEVRTWRAARPKFPDLSPANLFYAPAALAVSSGAMSADEAGRFAPTRPASGPDLVAALARISALTRR